MAEKRLTRGEAIRKHCVECSGGQVKEVRNCTVKKCYLYRYRMGTEETDSEKPKKKADATQKEKKTTKKTSSSTKKTKK